MKNLELLEFANFTATDRSSVDATTPTTYFLVSGLNSACRLDDTI